MTPLAACLLAAIGLCSCTSSLLSSSLILRTKHTKLSATSWKQQGDKLKKTTVRKKTESLQISETIGLALPRSETRQVTYGNGSSANNSPQRKRLPPPTSCCSVFFRSQPLPASDASPSLTQYFSSSGTIKSVTEEERLVKLYKGRLKPLLRRACGTSYGDIPTEKIEDGAFCTAENPVEKLITVVLFWYLYPSLQQKKKKRLSICSQQKKKKKRSSICPP